MFFPGLKYFFINIIKKLIRIEMKEIGDWGLGIGDWGLGIGPNPQSPIPNPQSPIPNPQLNLIKISFKKNNYFYQIKLNKIISI